MPVLLEVDRARLDPGEGADQPTKRRHRPTRLTADYSHDRLLLLWAGPLVGDHPDGPVAFRHLFGGATDDGEVETVEHDVVEPTLVDVLDEGEGAPALGRPRGQVAGHARTQVVAAARLEVLASDLPSHAGPLFRTFTCPWTTGARPWPARGERRRPGQAAAARRQRAPPSTRRAAAASRPRRPRR